jgi:membrane protease YdiL (CAAX protease family)
MLLLMSMHLGSWNAWTKALSRSSTGDWPFSAPDAVVFLALTFVIVYVAGAAALFVSFFPGAHPSKRLARWVYLPVAIGLTINVALVLYLSRFAHDVPLPDGQPFSWTLDGFASAIRAPGPAIWSTLLGTALVLYANLRVRSGNTHLPIHFAPGFTALPDGSSDCQVNRFIWMMLCLPLVTAFANLPVYYLVSAIRGILGHHGLPQSQNWPIYEAVGETWKAFALFVLLCVAMGSSRWETLRRSLRFPRVFFLALGIVLPTVVSTILPMLQYVFDRIHWAAYDFGRLDPPVFASYFSQLPQWHYYFLVLAALVEEIGWRGYLQPRFISRYGLYRGILLVGVVWAVFHFPFDPSSRTSVAQLFIHPAWRLLSCVAFGFALSWLTIRSSSIWPAALAHGFSNIFIVSGWRGLMSRWTVVLLWLLIDVILFRFWPPDTESGSIAELALDPLPQHPSQLLDTPT